MFGRNGVHAEEGVWDMAYRPRCRWRHRLGRDAGSGALRKFLAAALVLECAFGASQLLFGRLFKIPIVWVEEENHVEWFVPGTGEREGVYEVFGVQFRLEDGEIRFYRSSEEIISH